MKKLTHSELVEIAEAWLLKRCGFAFKELSTNAMEIPDAIGFRADTSILIECKTSRGDFLNDKKKVFRKHPWMGAGRFRYFLCEKGLIKPDELPDKWGLIYINKKGDARQKVGPIGNAWSADSPFYFSEIDLKKERALMYSALRRLHLQGVIPLIYKKFRSY